MNETQLFANRGKFHFISTRVRLAPENETGPTAPETPPAETTPKGTETPPTPEGESKPTDAAAAEGADQSKDGADKPKPWFYGRIDRLTARAAEAERLAADKDAEITLLKAALEAKAEKPADGDGKPAPKGEKMVPESQLKTEAQRIAAAAMREQEFTTKCNEMTADGLKAHPKDFMDKVAELGKIGENPQKMGMFMELAYETGHGAELIYQLGNNLDLANEVLSLSPTKLAMRLAKMAGEVKAPSVSSAPRPPEPINSRSPSATDDLRDDMPIEDWMKKRDRQVAERMKAGA